ncbi:MAG: rhombosortase [Pseudomonadota bacterium]
MADDEGRSGRLAWLVVGLLLAAPSLLLRPGHGLALAVLGWHAGTVWSEPWRCWSAAWPHLNGLHLAANLAGCAVVLALGWVAALPRRAAWAWALAWPLTHLALGLQPGGLLSYAGMSGVLHAGVAVAGLAICLRRRPGEVHIALAVLAGLALKLVLEWWADPAAPGALLHPPGWDLSVVPLAHVAGALAGLACAALLCRPGRVPASGAC